MDSNPKPGFEIWRVFTISNNNSTLAIAFAVADINDVYECFFLQVNLLKGVWIITNHYVFIGNTERTSIKKKADKIELKFFMAGTLIIVDKWINGMVNSSVVEPN